MDRRELLALAASVPLLAAPVSANSDSQPAPAETSGADTTADGSETVNIDIHIR